AGAARPPRHGMGDGLRDAVLDLGRGGVHHGSSACRRWRDDGAQVGGIWMALIRLAAFGRDPPSPGGRRASANWRPSSVSLPSAAIHLLPEGEGPNKRTIALLPVGEGGSPRQR